MSHFTVTVRITEECLARHGGNHHAAVEEILAPYQENNMGNCPRQFMDFHDTEAEYTEEYNSASVEMVRCHDGVNRYPWDAMFRKPRTFGIGFTTHEVPTTGGFETVTVPHRERFASLETFVADFHGTKARDPEKGRFGYWENPNAKWDWWGIGGRWRGYYPVKDGVVPIVGAPGVFSNESDGGSDVVTIDQIDMDAIATKERQTFEVFKAERIKFLAGEKFDDTALYGIFDGPRSQMLNFGLLRVEQDPRAELQPDEVQVGKTWGADHPNSVKETGPGGGAAWRVVAKVLSDDQLETYRCAFNPLLTYAAVDARGWHQPGQMGWFGCADHTPASYLSYAKAFQESFIRKVGPNDLLVIVDCHI